ncbi:M12 family metallo-peptidase [Rhodocaloribacter sp.]
MHNPKVRLILATTLTLISSCSMTVTSYAQETQNLFRSETRERTSLTDTQRELLNQLEIQGPIKAVNLVRTIDLSFLEQAGHVRLNISENKRFLANFFRKDDYGPGNYVWNARLPEVDGSAVLVVNDGQLTGIIRAYKLAEYYQVTPLGDGLYAIVTIDPAKLGPDESDDVYQNMRKNDNDIKEGQTQIREPGAAASSSTTTFDIIVFYTDDVRAEAGTTTIESEIQGATGELKTIYSNSQSGLNANLVHMEEISFTETGNSGNDLTTFLNNPDVQYKQDRYNADLAVLITKTLESGICGRVAMIDASYSKAYAIVRRKQGTFSCLMANKTFSHEIGHLQGGHHDNDTNTNPTYARGYNAGAYRTVMAVYDPNSVRIGYFSNPDVIAPGYGVTGTSSRDVVRRMEETVTKIAGFETFSPLSASVNGPICLQEGSNGLFSAGVNGGFGIPVSDFEFMRLCGGGAGADGSRPQPMDVNCDEWTYITTLTGTSAFSFGSDRHEDFLIRAIVDDENQTTITTSSKYVEVRPLEEGPCPSGPEPLLTTAAENGDVVEGFEMQPEAFDSPSFSLSQNYPNPFNPATRIDFSIPETMPVRLVVYDMLGREVARLVDAVLAPGVHQVNWESGGLPSGLYLYQMQAGAFREIRHMLLLK